MDGCCTAALNRHVGEWMDKRIAAQKAAEEARREAQAAKAMQAHKATWPARKARQVAQIKKQLQRR